MIRIASPLAAPVAVESGLSPEAGKLVTAQQTPDQLVSALEQNNLQGDAVKFLANGLSEKDSVCYAVKAAQKAADPSNLADNEAIQAAQAWLRKPGEATQKVAADAAEAAGHVSPGSWAAQAAAWARSGPDLPAVPDARGSLTAKAVAGAVQLAAAPASARAQAAAKAAEARAAALKPVTDATAEAQAAADRLAAIRAPQVSLETAVPESPLAKAQSARALQPYVDLGKDLANGKTSCG